MAENVAERRAQACARLVAAAHAATAKEGASPSALHEIRQLLVALAAEKELFPLEEFPLPEAQGKYYPLLVEDNDGYGLYLTVNQPGRVAAPHDHCIWCVNAAISGTEKHVFYRRTDNATVPGRAEIERTGEVLVEPGTGMAMADHDIHDTLTIGEAPAYCLALYGYALNRYPAVVWYLPEFGTTRRSPSRRHVA